MHLLNSRPSDAKALDYIRSKLFSSSSATRSIIRDDLDYVARAWREDSYDLWEEVKASGGGHFYTLMQQRRALIDGARFACRSEVRDVKSAEKWEAEARHMENVLEEFWNPTGQLGQEGGPHEGQQSDRKIFDPKDDPRLKDVPDHVLHRPHICPTLRRVQGQPKRACTSGYINTFQRPSPY